MKLLPETPPFYDPQLSAMQEIFGTDMLLNNNSLASARILWLQLEEEKQITFKGAA